LVQLPQVFNAIDIQRFMIYRMLCLFYINLYNSSTLSPIYRLFSTRVSVCIVLNHRTPLLDESVLKDCHIDFICKLVPCSAVRGLFCRYLQLAVWLQVNQFIMSSICHFLQITPQLNLLLRCCFCYNSRLFNVFNNCTL
jgi:hypothetical protein